MLRFGPAGWSYRDWEGIVYPSASSKTLPPLAIIARMFDVAEINVTFYNPPKIAVAKAWCDLLDRMGVKKFRFVVKLWRGLTHDASLPDQGEIARLAGICEELQGRGRLAAVLAQFPWSFRCNKASGKQIFELVEAWKGCPLAVEVRHSSWDRVEFFDWLREMNVALVNIDQPIIGDSFGPSGHVTTPELAYVRLHGQNREKWFAEGVGVEERYNYLYSTDELGPWGERIQAMDAEVKETVVITNNHFQGKAVANALEMQAALLPDGDVPVPATLIAQYPHLKAVPGLRKAKDEDFVLPAKVADDDSGQLEMF